MGHGSAEEQRRSGRQYRNWLAWVGLAGAIMCLILGAFLSAFFYLLMAFMGWSSRFADLAAGGKPTLGIKGRISIGVLMIFLAVLFMPTADRPQAQGIEDQTDGSASIKCDNGSKATGMDYAANDYVSVLTLPKAGADAVQQQIGQQKAPLIMEQGETIREHCRAGQWSKVHVPASDNDPRLYGWVPSSALRKVPTTDDGRRLYQSADFEWPKNIRADKTAVVKVINRIMNERRECEAISQTHLVYNDATKTFSVPCHAGGEMISFNFTAMDAAHGHSFAKVDPLAQADAIAACRGAVRQNATHPSTVKFPLLGYDFQEGQEGRTDVRMSASAQNGFGLTLRFKVWCEFDGADLKNFNMEEDAR